MALRRDADPGARFVTDGIEGRCIVALADLGDYEALVRVLNEHEVSSVYHLGAQTIVGTALRSPLSTFDANIRGTYALLEACRSLGDASRRADRRGVDRQGLRRSRRAALPRGLRAAGDLSVRRLEGLRRPDRALLCRHLRAAGGGHALRQRLRPGRRQLVPARARHGPCARPRRAARSPLGRHARARLPLRRRCRPGLSHDRGLVGPAGDARPCLERRLGEGSVRARAGAQADRGIGSRSRPGRPRRGRAARGDRPPVPRLDGDPERAWLGAARAARRRPRRAWEWYLARLG